MSTNWSDAYCTGREKFDAFMETKLGVMLELEEETHTSDRQEDATFDVRHSSIDTANAQIK